AEYDVISSLRKAKHEVMALGVQEELQPIRDAVESMKPHVVFNLLEEFHHNALYDHNIVSFLELIRVPYTGCNPRGLVISRDKALGKKLLGFPLIVKSLTEHASLGIAKASLVHDDAELEERVRFIHESLDTDAIAEQFIEGRELYVSVLGNGRARSLPAWELVIEHSGPNEPLIATAKVKHDLEYQERRGVQLQAANLDEPLASTIGRLSRRIYRILEMSGYARIDYRLDAHGVLWFLDANPNPDISASEELASAAKRAG